MKKGFKFDLNQQIAKHNEQAELSRNVGEVIVGNTKNSNKGILVRPNVVATGLIDQHGQKIDASLVKFIIKNQDGEELVIDATDIIICYKKEKPAYLLLLLAKNLRPKLFPIFFQPNESHINILQAIIEDEQSLQTKLIYKEIIPTNNRDINQKSIFPIQLIDQKNCLKQGTPIFIKTIDNDLKLFGICQKSNDSQSKQEGTFEAVRVSEEELAMLLPYDQFQSTDSIINSSSMMLQTMAQLRTMEVVNLSSESKSGSFLQEMALFNKKDMRIRMMREKIGLIYLSDSQQNTLVIGTGSLIGPQTVLTAAHVIALLLNDKKKLQPSYFYLQIAGKLSSSSPIKIIKYQYPPQQYPANGNQDYGLLFLQKPVLLAKYFPLAYNVCDKAKIQICGYPLDKYEQQKIQSNNSVFQQYGATGILNIVKERAYYDLPTTQGQSGSPVTTKDSSGEDVTIAVHSGSNDLRKQNLGCLMILKRISKIMIWMNKFSKEQRSHLRIVNLQAKQQDNVINKSTSSIMVSSIYKDTELGLIIGAKDRREYCQEAAIVQKYPSMKKNKQSIQNERQIKQQSTSIMIQNYDLSLQHRANHEYLQALQCSKLALMAAEMVNQYENYKACIHNLMGTIYQKQAAEQQTQQEQLKLIKLALLSYKTAFQVGRKSNMQNPLKNALYQFNIGSMHALISFYPNNRQQIELNTQEALLHYRSSIKTWQKYEKNHPQVVKYLLQCYIDVMTLLMHHKILPILTTEILKKLALHQAKSIDKYYEYYLENIPKYIDSQSFIKETENQLSNIESLLSFINNYIQSNKQPSIQKKVKQCITLLNQKRIKFIPS